VFIAYEAQTRIRVRIRHGHGNTAKLKIIGHETRLCINLFYRICFSNYIFFKEKIYYLFLISFFISGFFKDFYIYFY